MIRRVLLAVLLTLPQLAAASESAHGGHESHGVPWATLLFSTINLLIFFFVLKKYAWPSVVSAVAERRERVVNELERAAAATRAAESLRVEWESRLAALSSEIDAMRRQAHEEIARERDEILSAAQTAAARIRKDAERSAEQEVRQAQESLRAEAARQALALARDLAAQRITAADQGRFVADFLGKVNA